MIKVNLDKNNQDDDILQVYGSGSLICIELAVVVHHVYQTFVECMGEERAKKRIYNLVENSMLSDDEATDALNKYKEEQSDWYEYARKKLGELLGVDDGE